MLEILEALDSCVEAGKVRYCGLSDDTPWGINEYLIQNEFSLLHSKDWPYLIENCVHAGVAYLPWSPLAGGVLSGKYLGGARPAGSRWALSQRLGLFRDTETVDQAVAEYCKIAQQYHVTPAQLALAWCAQLDGVSSTIIGATRPEQLKENIAAFEITLSDVAIRDIDAVIRKYPIPF